MCKLAHILVVGIDFEGMESKSAKPRDGKARERARHESIPDVKLVVFDLVLTQKVDKFFFESDAPVMLFLVADIFQNIRDIRLAHAEGAIA